MSKETVLSENEWLAKETSELQRPVEVDSELKEIIVNYVGENHNPENNEVTLEMVIETFAKEFNGFLLPVAEENFIRGYKQALADVEAGEKMFAEYAESKQDD